METLCGVHHFYIGMGMTGLGYLLLHYGKRWVIVFGLILALIGGLMMIDDIWQHSMQRFVRGDYASPCKLIFWSWCKHCPLVSRIDMVVDGVFRGQIFLDK